MIIDPQIDFHEGGSLAVPGALEDSKRIAKMIDDYGSHIHEIYVSLDSHYPKHIAHAICWRHIDYYKQDKSRIPRENAKRIALLIKNYIHHKKVLYDNDFRPKPYTVITYQDIVDGI